MHRVNAAPYHGCYWLMDGLAIGPNPICSHPDETRNRRNALRRASVRCVVSLLSRDEFFFSREEDNEAWLENFDHHVFPICDGGTPTKPAMRLVLNVIEERVSRNAVVLVHFWRGRGRARVWSCLLRRAARNCHRPIRATLRRAKEIGDWALCASARNGNPVGIRPRLEERQLKEWWLRRKYGTAPRKSLRTTCYWCGGGGDKRTIATLTAQHK